MLYIYTHLYCRGTNPSLLEQLQFDRPIIAFDVPFHREILGKNGIYFRNKDGLMKTLYSYDIKGCNNVRHTIPEIYDWDVIDKIYSELFRNLFIKNTLFKARSQ